MSKDRPSLPTDQAFVVQFHTDIDAEKGLLKGRTEHLVSGQATHFESVEDLLAFITRVLRTVKQNEDEDETVL